MYHFFFLGIQSQIQFQGISLAICQTVILSRVCIGFKKFGYPYPCMVYGYKME